MEVRLNILHKYFSCCTSHFHISQNRLVKSTCSYLLNFIYKTKNVCYYINSPALFPYFISPVNRLQPPPVFFKALSPFIFFSERFRTPFTVLLSSMILVLVALIALANPPLSDDTDPPLYFICSAASSLQMGVVCNTRPVIPSWSLACCLFERSLRLVLPDNCGHSFVRCFHLHDLACTHKSSIPLPPPTFKAILSSS